MLVFWILEQLPGNQGSIERLSGPHRRHVLVDSVFIVAPLTVNLSSFCEKMLVQSYFIDKYLLSKGINIIDDLWPSLIRDPATE